MRSDYRSADQLRPVEIIPDWLATAEGSASVRVFRSGKEVASGTLAVAAAAPGLFVGDTMNLAGSGAILDQNSRPVSDLSPAARDQADQFLKVLANSGIWLLTVENITGTLCRLEGG